MGEIRRYLSNNVEVVTDLEQCSRGLRYLDTLATIDTLETLNSLKTLDTWDTLETLGTSDILDILAAGSETLFPTSEV